MPSIKDLKKRISSTRTTKQTTKAMKMVSAAKLRRAQEAIISHRPYAKQMARLIQEISILPEADIDSQLIAREQKPSDERKVLLVLVTSDRGLCGGFNGNIIKSALRWIQENSAQCKSIKYGFVGKRGYDYFKTKNVEIDFFASELGGKVTFAKARKLADLLKDKYLAGEYSEVKIIFNEFKNAISQQVVTEDFLPLKVKAPNEGAPVVPVGVLKPNAMELFDALVHKHFSVHAFRAMLESQASEHGARMSAMENATKNAEEMIKKLTLQFNKQRQAGITKELLEIISGSESQNAN